MHYMSPQDNWGMEVGIIARYIPELCEEHFSPFNGNYEPVTLVKISMKQCQKAKIYENFLLMATFRLSSLLTKWKFGPRPPKN